MAREHSAAPASPGPPAAGFPPLRRATAAAPRSAPSAPAMNPVSGSAAWPADRRHGCVGERDTEDAGYGRVCGDLPESGCCAAGQDKPSMVTPCIRRRSRPTMPGGGGGVRKHLGRQLLAEEADLRLRHLPAPRRVLRQLHLRQNPRAPGAEDGHTDPNFGGGNGGGTSVLERRQILRAESVFSPRS